MKFFVAILSVFAVSVCVFASKKTIEKDNKQIVEAFYNLAFNKHQPVEAMARFAGEQYIQHNPFAGDGKQPFIDFFLDYHSKNPEAFVEIKRVIAENDLVVVHVHSKQNKNDRGTAVVDIFRLEKGKIVEHWDVMQPIAEKSANSNTMF